MQIIQEKIKKEGENLRREATKKTVGYITAAFGLVAGLAWNEAIKSLIEYFYPMSQNTMVAKFIYAVLITAVLVVVTVYLIKLFPDGDEGRK